MKANHTFHHSTSPQLQTKSTGSLVGLIDAGILFQTLELRSLAAESLDATVVSIAKKHNLCLVHMEHHGTSIKHY